MKKSIFISLLILGSSLFVFAQQQKLAPSQFTKAELLAFGDLKALLASINPGQDYSKYIVRNFSLSITLTNGDGTKTKLSESGPGGKWSEKQKNMIEKQAVKGAVFTLENMVMIEQGKKDVFNQPDISFFIKE